MTSQTHRSDCDAALECEAGKSPQCPTACADGDRPRKSLSAADPHRQQVADHWEDDEDRPVGVDRSPNVSGPAGHMRFEFSVHLRVEVSKTTAHNTSELVGCVLARTSCDRPLL